jgi:hypothetical protein
MPLKIAAPDAKKTTVSKRWEALGRWGDLILLRPTAKNLPLPSE